MKVKITSGYTGVLPTGSYANERPNIQVETEFDVPEEFQNGRLPEFIKLKHEELSSICYSQFKELESRAVIERIHRERQDIRFYGEYPSVSSITGWDADFFVSAEELSQYAAQGNLIDLQFKEYIKTGKIVPIEDIEEAFADLVICKKGSLHLPTSGWNIAGFLEKHPLDKMEIGKPVLSHEHKFGGTPDIRVCYYEGKKTLADVKRTPDPEKHFSQIAGYIIAEEENGESPYEQMLIIPINDKTKQGWSKPLVSTKVSQFKKLFLDKRERFQRRFGC